MRPRRCAAMASENQNWAFTVGVSSGCAELRTTPAVLFPLLKSLIEQLWEGLVSGCNKLLLSAPGRVK